VPPMAFPSSVLRSEHADISKVWRHRWRYLVSISAVLEDRPRQAESDQEESGKFKPNTPLETAGLDNRSRQSRGGHFQLRADLDRVAPSRESEHNGDFYFPAKIRLLGKGYQLCVFKSQTGSGASMHYQETFRERVIC
jgi:hypothetical protein